MFQFGFVFVKAQSICCGLKNHVAISCIMDKIVIDDALEEIEIFCDVNFIVFLLVYISYLDHSTSA